MIQKYIYTIGQLLIDLLNKYETILNCCFKYGVEVPVSLENNQHVAATVHPDGGPRLLSPPQTIRLAVDQAIARVFAVAPDRLAGPNRDRAPIALARQIAMYTAHVTFGLTFTDVGLIYARDRTTVRHACSLVEDRRDDQGFDRSLDLIEGIVRCEAVARLGFEPAKSRRSA